MGEKKIKIVSPQPGFQQKFTRSNCDVCFGGGTLNPQPLTSHILTPDGFKRFSEVRAGDEVMGLNGKVQHITHCELMSEKECISITLADGSYAESALDHKWWVKKNGCDDTVISFELLESYQIAQEMGVFYDVYAYRYVNGETTPVRIKEVKEIGKRDVACIGVSNDDQLYITDDYMVTKNCGKAQPYSAKVLTPRGFVEMGTLKEGDEVCDPKGGVQTVVKIHEKGIRDVYRIQFADGATECCGDHLWSVSTAEDSTEHILTTRELIYGGGRNYRVKTGSFYQEGEELAIAPYILGKVVGLQYSVKYHISKSIIEILTMEGIDLDDIKIPDIYLRARIEDREEVLRGVIDSQERRQIIGDSLTIVVKNSAAKTICQLILSLGGAVLSSYLNKNDKKNIRFRMRDWSRYNVPGLNSANSDNYRHIIGVIPIGKKQCRCISVSGEDHLYVTDDYILTHNTYAAILTVAQPSLNPKFCAVFTRRNLAELKAGGGIVQDFSDAYGSYVSIKMSDNPRITFPSGAFVDCAHIANEEPKALMERVKGWQYDFAYLDELTSYQFSTFKIIQTRIRGKSDWTGHLFGTTNPKRSHWTRKMLDWYIGPDGFIRPERDGVVRYFFLDGENVEDIVWGSTKKEVYLRCKPTIDRQLKKLGGDKWTYENLIRSFVFYAGKMSENQASIGNNGNYIGSVAAVGGKRAQQLIEGNFNVDEDDIEDIPIPSSLAQEVFTNDPCVTREEWITVDLADVGTDNLIALHWIGLHINDVLILTNSTPRENARRIKQYAEKHGVPDTHIIYDGTHGTYMLDYIPNAVAFISSGASRGLLRYQAERLKDACYMRLCQVIAAGHMSFSTEIAEKRYLHQNIKQEYTIQTEFLQECSVVRFKESPSGKKKLFGKKEMNAMLGKHRSMDLLDPCAMRMLPLLDVKEGEELNEQFISGENNNDGDDGTVDIWDESTWA